MTAAAGNYDLQPSLARDCEQERLEFCKDVKPGMSRIYNCLTAMATQVRPTTSPTAASTASPTSCPRLIMCMCSFTSPRGLAEGKTQLLSKGPGAQKSPTHTRTQELVYIACDQGGITSRNFDRVT